MERRTEFNREIPDNKDVVNLTSAYTYNRNQIVRDSENLGLNKSFLLNQGPATIGPFVSPAPIPTTYAGKVASFQTSLWSIEKIADCLKQKGVEAKKALTVVIEMSEMPNSKGPDAFVVPKNKTSNQKVSIPRKAEKSQPYGSIKVTATEIGTVMQRLSEMFPQYLEIFPELKRRKTGWKILECLLADLAQATSTIKNPEEFSYLNFSAAFNSLIGQRINPNVIDYQTVAVDAQTYSPFLRYGIDDISKFTQVLDGIDFFVNEPNFVKIIGPDGRVKLLRVVDTSKSDALLQFNFSDVQVRYSSLATTKDIAPCKELSYFLCFGSFVPVIYGSENSGGFYKPYAIAKSQVEQLGLSPILYRIQPQIPEDYQELGTVFDFYRDIVMPDTENIV